MCHEHLLEQEPKFGGGWLHREGAWMVQLSPCKCPPHLVSCPARVRLPARNGLVKEVEFKWAYSPKVVRTNKLLSTSLTGVINLCTFSEQIWRKMIWTLLNDTVTKVCASPRNSTWFTRPFLLMRGWGLQMRLHPTILDFAGRGNSLVNCLYWITVTF